MKERERTQTIGSSAVPHQDTYQVPETIAIATLTGRRMFADMLARRIDEGQELTREHQSELVRLLGDLLDDRHKVSEILMHCRDRFKDVVDQASSCEKYLVDAIDCATGTSRAQTVADKPSS